MSVVFFCLFFLYESLIQPPAVVLLLLEVNPPATSSSLMRLFPPLPPPLPLSSCRWEPRLSSSSSAALLSWPTRLSITPGRPSLSSGWRDGPSREVICRQVQGSRGQVLIGFWDGTRPPLSTLCVWAPVGATYSNCCLPVWPDCGVAGAGCSLSCETLSQSSVFVGTCVFGVVRERAETCEASKQELFLLCVMLGTLFRVQLCVWDELSDQSRIWQLFWCWPRAQIWQPLWSGFISARHPSDSFHCLLLGTQRSPQP